MSRALLVAAVAVTVGVAVGGCSSTPARSVPVTVKASPLAVVSDVRCASESRSVTVTGTVTAEAISVPKPVPVTLFVVVAARVYDSAGSQIGTNKRAAPGLRQGHSRSFDIVVETSDNPARCLVTSATGLD